MFDACRGACLEEVASRGLEEFHHRLVLERRRIGEVDHHLRASQRVVQALAGESVDTRILGCCEDLVALFPQPFDGLRADQSGAANDNDFHA